ncbi:hypothetical protein RchiOBHm_Chr5g0067621 [Rosa chinensis]|uniref:Uncharacterized protein n=1 Tax=Rosa chinensis TaxID=74649 RepID=A0A2P6QJH2_ROSCH|nr:hypothetical protein RchiOBHm_Chr5g0067621 [Rosa chinensis]
MEIEELNGKLEVMKHLGDEDDEAVKKKIEDMNQELGEKVKELEHLEILNQTLITKERQSNDELQEARKVLIAISYCHRFIHILKQNICTLMFLFFPTYKRQKMICNYTMFPRMKAHTV